MHSEAQYTAFNRLYDLYEKGIMVILDSISIGSYIHDSLFYSVFDPRLSLSTEHMLISEAAFDEELFREISMHVSNPRKVRPTKYIERVEELLKVPLSQYKVLTLQHLTATVLQITAFDLNSKCTDIIYGNKKMYTLDKLNCNMLKIAANFGFISDMLYIAMYFYTTGRYMCAISIINDTKVKLREPGLIYYRNWDPERYIEAVGGQSWSRKMKEAVAADIVLHKNILYIPEMTPEQVYSSENKQFFLFIPPFILVYMLEFLCHQHVDSQKASTALQNLQDVVIMDRRIRFLADISWNILGICHQMSGNLWAALFCYIHSLRQARQNRIHKVTAMRMLGVMFCIMKSRVL